MRIKLINLNVWFGGRLWDSIVAYLRQEQPDILMLQEAYAAPGTDLPPHMTTAASLQRLCNLPYGEYEAQFILKESGEVAPSGNAILSRFPLTNKQVIWLKGTGAIPVNGDDRDSIPTFPRNLLHCQSVISGSTYNLMTLQGVWAKDGTETPDQQAMARRIADYVKDKPNTILSGDFNVNESTSAINLLSQNLNNIFQGERISSFNMKHKTNPGYATAIVDFVFASPNIKVTDHYTSDADVSDHQSQVVELDL